MAADEPDFIAQREDLVADRFQKLLVIAAGQIGSADRAVEQHVAEMGKALLPVDIDDMAGRMARAMENLEFMLAEGDLVALLQEAVRRDVAHAADVEHLAFGFDILEQEAIVLMRADHLDAERLPHLVGTAGMIDMAVRQPDGLEGNAVLAHRLQDDIDIAARVDHHALFGLRIEQDGAVLFERGHRNDAGLEHAHGAPRLFDRRAVGITANIRQSSPRSFKVARTRQPNLKIR